MKSLQERISATATGMAGMQKLQEQISATARDGGNAEIAGANICLAANNLENQTGSNPSFELPVVC